MKKRCAYLIRLVDKDSKVELRCQHQEGHAGRHVVQMPGPPVFLNWVAENTLHIVELGNKEQGGN